jgi:hypothetical protein
MPLRRLLALSVILAVVWGAVPALAGVTPCCPHRPGKVRIVRAGGLGMPAGGAGEASVVGSCEACSAWEVCAMELESAGAGMQAMLLRNGVMSVYTSGSPDRMRVVRNALTRYQEHMLALTMTGDAVRLCPACRLMRGAAASGRLMREVIPIEGGGILLVTSPDPAVVEMLRAEAGVVPAPRAKR